MHLKEIAADLRVGRRESGLSNQDLAHLLAVDTARISRLENGKTELTLKEVCSLSLIYGKPVDGLLQICLSSVSVAIKDRLVDMPDEPEYWKAYEQRRNTLNTLAQTLETLTLPVYEA